MQHLLITPALCSCEPRSDTPCPVCDHGLGVCFYCNAAEVELDTPCKANWQKRLARRGAWKMDYLRSKGLSTSDNDNWKLAEEAWREASGETTDPLSI